MQRRTFLTGLAAATGLPLMGGSLTFAAAPGSARLVVVLLRGGLDGLAAVPAVGDPAFTSARGSLADNDLAPIPLDDTFGLHPSLGPLAAAYRKGELLVVHATAPPYRERSHFDGQNVLENGTDVPFGLKTGWLNRALATRSGAPPALAVGRSVPLLLRGPARAASADPLRKARHEDAFLSRVRTLYGEDPALGPALEEGMAMQARLAQHQQRGSGDVAVRTVRVVARVLASDDGPRVAVLDMGGFDTHTNQQGSLSRQLSTLGGALAAFADEMPADVWRKTVVLTVTEFGRTVGGNGSGGSDHGVGGAAFVLGGGVAGGRVLTDWPSLAAAKLHEGRDLRPTLDLRALFKGVLHDHLQVAEASLHTDVFPGSDGVVGLQGLLKG